MDHMKYVSNEETGSNLDETPPLFICICYHLFHISDAISEIKNLNDGILHDKVT